MTGLQIIYDTTNGVNDQMELDLKELMEKWGMVFTGSGEDPTQHTKVISYARPSDFNHPF